MWNAEFGMQNGSRAGRIGRLASGIEPGLAIPHSALRIPHWFLHP